MMEPVLEWVAVIAAAEISEMGRLDRDPATQARFAR